MSSRLRKIRATLFKTLRQAISQNNVLISAGAVIAIVAALQLSFHLGFRFGPYAVKPGDTLYGILTDVFEGSQFHAAETINNWRIPPNPNVVYANKNPQLQDGDTVTVRYNTLTITRPNGASYQTELVDPISLRNRNVQLLLRNLLVLLLAASFFSLVYLALKIPDRRRIIRYLGISTICGGLALIFFEFGLYVARVLVSL